MATTFTAPPSWSNVGVAPSETLKTNGFQAGYKPPAPVFNYMFNKYGICIDELQKGKADTSHTHTMSDITGLAEEFNKKANVSHVHADYEKKTGKSLHMQKVYPESGVSAVAGTGAEIFNDYRKRTFGQDPSTSDDVQIAMQGNVASGDFSHAEGMGTTASAYASHSEGDTTTASGHASHSEGSYSTASGDSSHAEGSGAASGDYSHAEGRGAASGDYSHTEGSGAASGNYSHAEGFCSTASGDYSHAEGDNAKALGYASHAGGCRTKANAFQFVTGKYNIEKTGCTDESDQSTDNSIFIVGYGTSLIPANAFRITAAGKCMGAQSFGSSGADYAEFFEWRDGNKKAEDRRGLFVTLDGDKIRLATAADDYIVGVISANPSVVGDVQSENWHGMYKKDVFGQPLTETVEVPESTDEETGEVVPAHTITRYVVNPDYDPDEEYTSREFRKEWACVGLMGKLVVVDDGTCEVNGYCKAADGGKATKSDTGYRVMKRIDSTHIQILYR